MTVTTSGRLKTSGAPDRPLLVKLVQEPQPVVPLWRRYLPAAVLVILVLIYAGLFVAYLFPESTPLVSAATAPLNVQLRYAEFASVGDTGYIELTITNTGDRPISGTLVVAFAPTVSVSLLTDNQAHLTFADLPPGGRVPHRLEYRTLGPWDLPVTGSLPFRLLLLTSSGKPEPLTTAEIGLMPLPHLSWGLGWLRTGVLASLAALLWERIKKWLFP
jgi:hypothetical protein